MSAYTIIISNKLVVAASYITLAVTISPGAGIIPCSLLLCTSIIDDCNKWNNAYKCTKILLGNQLRQRLNKNQRFEHLQTPPSGSMSSKRWFFVQL
jgi:hypothetical protein